MTKLSWVLAERIDFRADAPVVRFDGFLKCFRGQPHGVCELFNSISSPSISCFDAENGFLLNEDVVAAKTFVIDN